jgi:hypothetical protein
MQSCNVSFSRSLKVFLIQLLILWLIKLGLERSKNSSTNTQLAADREENNRDWEIKLYIAQDESTNS